MEFQFPRRNPRVEDYKIDRSGVTVLELIIVPDFSRRAARASLKSLRLS